MKELRKIQLNSTNGEIKGDSIGSLNLGDGNMQYELNVLPDSEAGDILGMSCLIPYEENSNHLKMCKESLTAFFIQHEIMNFEIAM